MNNSCLENIIYARLKKKLNDSVHIYKEYSVKGFPVDIFIKSGKVSLWIEVDDPQHFFTDDNCNLSKKMKDHFIDYIINTKLNYKLMRISYMEIKNTEYLDEFVRDIVGFFHSNNK